MTGHDHRFRDGAQETPSPLPISAVSLPPPAALPGEGALGIPMGFRNQSVSPGQAPTPTALPAQAARNGSDWKSNCALENNLATPITARSLPETRHQARAPCQHPSSPSGHPGQHPAPGGTLLSDRPALALASGLQHPCPVSSMQRRWLSPGGVLSCLHRRFMKLKRTTDAGQHHHYYHLSRILSVPGPP